MAIVLAEMGLVPYRGQVVRTPDLFEGRGAEERRREYLVHRLAFVRANTQASFCGGLRRALEGRCRSWADSLPQDLLGGNTRLRVLTHLPISTFRLVKPRLADRIFDFREASHQSADKSGSGRLG